MLARLFFWGLFASVTMAAERETVEADTSLGRIRGYQESVLGKNINVFAGVPYAKPPVGSLRFRRPEAIEPWEGIREAITPPRSCYQAIDTSFNQFKGVDMWNPNTEMSEDCLNLNIWAPAERTYDSGRAVVVWLYGGGFYSGSSTLPLYDGRIMASKGDVIVASLNYRSGPLGFLYLGRSEAPGNMGLLDQQLAIRWIYNHIETFGGDKTRITLVGESAGASSVSFHLLSPLSKDLIKSAIMQSATATCPWAIDPKPLAKSRTLDFLKKVGCESEDETMLLDCVNKKNASQISDYQWSVDDVSMIQTPLVPTVDDYFFTEMPKETLKQGKMKKTSILLGVMHDEGAFFLYYANMDIFKLNRTNPLTKEEYMTCLDGLLQKYKGVDLMLEAINFEYSVPYTYHPSTRYRDVLDDILGDYSFICPVVEFANSYVDNDQKVYVYRFLHRTSGNPWPAWTGAMHGYEIDHVFGMPLLNVGQYTDEERVLSQQVLTYWTNFAKSGDPNVDDEGRKTAYEWPVYNAEEKKHLNLDTPNLSVDHSLRGRQCSFWKDFIPKIITSAKKQEACGACQIGSSFALLLMALGCLLFTNSA